MTDDQPNETVEASAAAEEAALDAVSEELPPQYGLGPFTIREVALAGLWLVAFVVSFFPIYGLQGPSVWSNGIDWILMIGLPTVAVFLIGLRRLSPQGIRRVGSLGIDQFASVAFSVATVLWLTVLWNSLIALAQTRGIFVASWVVWVEFFLMLAGVFLTAFAPFIAPFEQDFQGRPEVPAHRSARPVRPVSPRPAPVPAPPAAGPEGAAGFAPAEVHEHGGYPDDSQYGATAYAGTGFDTDETVRRDDWAPHAHSESFEPAESFESAEAAEPAEAVEAAAEQAEAAEPEAESAAATGSGSGQPAGGSSRIQAFWALAPEERDIVDENGVPLFRVGPTAWAIVIEDRGATYVVRHEDGRIGYLHDVEGVTRG